MPTSDYNQINIIVELIILSNPGSLLDIGVGFGKYGFLSREYLELHDGRMEYDIWERTIDGVEIYEKYIKKHHFQIYSDIYVGNILELMPSLPAYDLILLIDVIEHFTFEEGMYLLNECNKHCRNMIIATPLSVGPQEDAFGNPYEVHKYQWSKKDFTAFPDRCYFRTPFKLICYIGDDYPKVKKQYKRNQATRWSRLLFPFLRKPYNCICGMLTNSSG